MDFLREADDIDAIVPGAADAYRRLRDSRHQGIYTSLGRYYNHTIFARDAGMTAKFISDFDHETAWDTIVTLASYQGRTTNHVTQEQPGRIHHELRDFTSWQGSSYDRLGLVLAGRVWGARNKQFLTYFSTDTTATYLRLIHKYATNIDPSIIDRHVPQRDGSTVSLAESVTAAANWLVRQVDQDGVFRIRRTNRWSLPYQTFCDSVSAYVWSSGAPADVTQDHSYIEAQVYALDALQDAMRILPSSPELHYWRLATEKLHAALFDRFWIGTRQTFAPALFMRGHRLAPLDTEMITTGWALNASFWEHMPSRVDEQAHIITVVKRLFSEDFLTDVGIRTRSLSTNDPLETVIDYHGSETVWPMFNFMVIEGLRRHGLYRLARQLEYRILNGINATGGFPEFMIVDRAGALCRPSKHARQSRSAQMIPEQSIAFTVVPAITLAYRHLYKRHTPAKSGWKYDLEESILATISDAKLIPAKEAVETLRPAPLRIRRTWASIRSAAHIAPVILRKP